MTSRCAVLFSVVGIGVGILSGLFGVGGGFVIVPALVMFSGMSIHRAIATSLLVITFVSVSGVTSHLLAGRNISSEITLLFIVGGVVGLFLGNFAGRQFASQTLQRIFAVAMVGVATFVMTRTLL